MNTSRGPSLRKGGARVAPPLLSHLERGALWELRFLTPERTRSASAAFRGIVHRYACKYKQRMLRFFLLYFFPPRSAQRGLDRRRAISGPTPTRTPFILRGTRLVTTTRRGRLRRNGGK